MRTSRCTTFAAVLAVLCGAWLFAPATHAVNTIPMNVSDLIRESDQIVVGTVSAVNSGFQKNQLPYTEVVVNVSESIRGNGEKTLTFRQFGLPSAQPAKDGRRYVGLVAGMPQYKPGEHVVLFLSRSSSIGYRSTIGLGLGKFSLRGGNLENEFNNAGLFQNLKMAATALDEKESRLVQTEQGAVGAEAFLGFVRRAVSEKWFTVKTPKGVTQ